MRTSARSDSGYARGTSAKDGAPVRAMTSPSTQPSAGVTLRPSPGRRTWTRLLWMKSPLPRTSISVDEGMSVTRLAEAKLGADHTDPGREVRSHSVGGSTPPTSLALTQPGPGCRVSPSPLYWTKSQSGRDSTCLSRLHCGKRVKTCESSVGPDRNGVSVWFLTH